MAVELTRDRLDEAADAIADGFEQDPIFVHLIPDTSRRRKVTRLIILALLRESVRHRGTYVVIEDDEILGGAIAFPPGAYPPGVREEFSRLPTYLRIAAIDPRLVPRLLRLSRTSLAHMPHDESYWYVLEIAIRPGRRSFAALLELFRTLIDRVDREGAAAYLETTHPEVASGVQRYFGFEVREEEVRLTEHGPASCTLWRQPAGARVTGPGD